IRRALADHGLECTVCSIILQDFSLVSADAAVRQRTITHLEDVIKTTADLGATVLDGPLYAPVGYLPGRRRTADEWCWAIEGYQTIAPTLAANGVTLAIEPLNRFETYFLNTVADVAAICDAVAHPNVGIAFDTFHANIEEKNVAEACRAIGRHLKHVQVSENDRGTPGSGHVGWAAFFQVLADLGYDDWLTIESFGPNLGAFSSAVCIWRDIEPSPDDIAFDGLAFLKRSLPGASRR
ncbi:MAG: sugar phosphate isomerase/epimerase, partial [Rhodospirillales bacterium]|nr:sugar phosphate isomerase/epimerase [Rhodospirillales bacterium]